MHKGDFLVVNYGHLGDAALSFVFNQNLKRFFLDCNIFSIVSKSNIEFFEKFDSSLSKVFLYDENYGFKDDSLKSLNINTVIFLRGASKKTYCDIFTLLKKIFPKATFIGMIKEEDEKEPFDDCYLEREKNISILKQIFNFVKFLTGKQEIIIPRITIKYDYGLKDNIIKKFDNNNPIIYVNLSAGNKKNIWDYIRRNLSAKKYYKLIKILLKKKYNIITTASLEDCKKAKFIKDSFKEFKNFMFLDTNTISELVFCINSSDVIVSPETAVVHIASLLNKPIVGLYISKKRITEWPPFSEKFRCVLPKFEGYLKNIKIEEIIKNIDVLLNN